jgi:hypothetical protein
MELGDFLSGIFSFQGFFLSCTSLVVSISEARVWVV